METHKRSIVKALTWRVIAYVITALTVFVITKDVGWALSIGFADTGIKLFVYYGHERAWMKINFGRKKEIPEDYTI